MNDKDKKAQQATVDAKVAFLKTVSIPFNAALEQILSDAAIGNTLAMYNTGVEFKPEEIANEAGLFVIKGLIGSLCYNVIEGAKRGVQKLAEAEDQMDSASNRDDTFRTEKSADQLHQRIVWCAKMDVQQVYRAALQEFVLGLYTSITGERYQQSAARSDRKGGVDSPEQSVVEKMRARKAAASA